MPPDDVRVRAQSLSPRERPSHRRLRALTMHCRCCCHCCACAIAGSVVRGAASSGDHDVAGEVEGAAERLSARILRGERQRAHLYPTRCHDQPLLRGLGAVDASAARRFRREGFLVCQRALNARTTHELAAVVDAMARSEHEVFARALERAGCRAAAGGGSAAAAATAAATLPVLYESRQPERQLESTADALSAHERERFVRKLNGFVECDDRFRVITRSPAWRAAIRTLLSVQQQTGGGGGTTAGSRGSHEPMLFQDMALLKPRGGGEKPWHQDNAYFVVDEHAAVVGCWIALQAATVHNGCMRVLPGGHRTHRPHFQRRDWCAGVVWFLAAAGNGGPAQQLSPPQRPPPPLPPRLMV
jgi:hypothetical protein